MEELCLTTCKHFQMFSYRYMEQSMMKPNSLQYFKNVMQALDTLHEQSLVHSDVRFANLLSKGINVLTGRCDIGKNLTIIKDIIWYCSTIPHYTS